MLRFFCSYDEIFDGVVLAYYVDSLDKCAKVLPGVYPYFGVNLKVNMLLFSPKPDMLLGNVDHFFVVRKIKKLS